MTAAATRTLGLLPGIAFPAGEPLAPQTGAVGAQVVGDAFVAALLRHRSRPVDQFVSRAHATSAAEALRSAGPIEDQSQAHRWHLRPYEELPRALEQGRLAALHTFEGPLLRAQVLLRARFAPRPLPLTAVTHGLAGPEHLHLNLLALLRSGSMPCDAIVCASRAARSALECILAALQERLAEAGVPVAPFQGALPLIPWGVDVDRFSPGDRGAARRWLDLPAAQPIVLVHGRLDPATKMDLAPALFALDRLRRSGRRLPVLVISGSDHGGYGARVLRSAHELGLAQQVRLIRDVPPALLPDLYSAADVFLSVSDTVTESFGLTLIEAMACGLPVVASDWNGYRDVVSEGVTGFLVPTR